MEKLKHRKLELALAMVALVGLGLAFHQQIIGRVAYAVEKGQLEANGERLSEMHAVEEISETFRMVAKQVKPAVVRITTRIIEQAEASQSQHPPMDLERIPEQFREFFKDYQERMPDKQPPRESMGSGSGVIIDADEGFILTNNHVVNIPENAEYRIDVQLEDRRTVPAKIVGHDPRTDLALIKIDADRLHQASLGDSDDMQTGDWVLAIGAPFGLAETVTQGIISAKGRSRMGIAHYEDFIQTDAAINPGNSGGPLVNMKGQVIGINTAIATNPMVAGYMGVGFSIPSKMIKDLLPKLKEGKEIERGFLGVAIKGLEEFPPGVGKSFGLDEDRGVLVEHLLDPDVYGETPASKAGLQTDDIILEFNGEKVSTATELQDLVGRTDPDTEISLTVWRDNKEIKIPVTIGRMPQDFSAFSMGPGKGGQGPQGRESQVKETTIEPLAMTVSEMTETLAEKYGWEYEKVQDNLIVTEVEPLGEAYVKGLRPGDLIESVQSQSISAIKDLKEALSEEALAKGVRVRVEKRKYGSTMVFFRLNGRS